MELWWNCICHRHCIQEDIGKEGREECTWNRRRFRAWVCYVTVLGCGSANGIKLLPFVIYKRKNLWTFWMSGGPSGTFILCLRFRVDGTTPVLSLVWKALLACSLLSTWNRSCALVFRWKLVAYQYRSHQVGKTTRSNIVVFTITHNPTHFSHLMLGCMRQ